MSGRLPVTLPAYPAAIPVRYNDRQSAAHVYKDAAEPILRGFGYGAGSLAAVTFSEMHADTQSHPGEVLVQVTAHAERSWGRGCRESVRACRAAAAASHVWQCLSIRYTWT